MTKIPLKAITVTYTKTTTYTPTSKMFDDWDCPPSQEGFESLVLGEFFDDLLGDVMPYTDVQRFEDVVVEWKDFWEDDDA